jgi:putative flavoprotein involved in K+ transport
VILERHERVGDGWREHYDSLRLYTPARYDGLPGRPFPGDPQHFPTGREMADHLEAYASAQGLPVRTGVGVVAVRPTPDGAGYVVETPGRRYECANVVVAAGCKHRAHTPDIARDLDPGIRQVHSGDYRDPSQLLPGPVLVVGVSHSGSDLALEAAAGHRTYLSGPLHGQLPFELEGPVARRVQPVMWFMANHVLTLRTPLGRKMQPEVRGHGGPLLRVKLSHLAAAGVEHIEAKTVGVRDGMPVLEDGRVLEVANVIWCTGFRPDFAWVDVPFPREGGWPVQRRGVVEGAPGLYVLGLLFQYAFASMLVGGAGRDAEHVARHIASRTPARGRSRRDRAAA